ncbi:MAG: ATP-binding cassette domain-containing protein, partial [Planctomycetes bacterium]|nr:ATP-binding cassette domain-containing protein [Planctomycetota bacterium]
MHAYAGGVQAHGRHDQDDAAAGPQAVVALVPAQGLAGQQPVAATGHEALTRHRDHAAIAQLGRGAGCLDDQGFAGRGQGGGEERDQAAEHPGIVGRLPAFQGRRWREDAGVPHRLTLVGYRASGKSTVGRLAVGLYSRTRGRVLFDGRDISRSRGPELAGMRRRMQMIFQDPHASLNPRWRVEDIVAEPLRVLGLVTSRTEGRRKVGELLEQVGLSAADARKFPHQFSGGQRQRISIARALSSSPEFLVCDE